jgi:hypothetical protein
MPRLTDKTVREAMREVRRTLRETSQAWDNLHMCPYAERSNYLNAAFAAAERLQEAAFDLKVLFSITDFLPVEKKRDDSGAEEVSASVSDSSSVTSG